MKITNVSRSLFANLSKAPECHLNARLIVARAHTKPSEEPVEIPTAFDDSDVNKQELRKMDTSRLLPQHRKMLREERPYSEPQLWIHLTQKYNRMMFGRYGLESGVDPRICFATKSDLEQQAEFEQFAFPDSVLEMIEICRKEKEEKAAQIRKREEDIDKKMAKLEQWKRDLHNKIAKKEADAKAAKERKERLVEEVRRHFGFKVDPREDRFKEMLEQKEREDRKKTKEAKRKAKESKMMDKLKQTAKVMDSQENQKSTEEQANKSDEVKAN